MITLATLAELAAEYAGDLNQPVAPVRIGLKEFDLDARPGIMGCINLSRDSTYRDSVAVSIDSAVRRGLILAAQGADIIDVGAESSGAAAARVSPDDQVAALVPVIEQLAAAGPLVSVETYSPAVAGACLQAGACMVNYSGGAAHDDALFEVAAEYEAAVVLCFVPGSNVRDAQDQAKDADPIPRLLDHFAGRIEVARAQGVEDILIDPGIGFSFGPPEHPSERMARQTRTLLNSFRLRRLGLPICQALPHAFDIFESEFRTAEAFFAMLAQLGGCGMFRTHEVARVLPVLTALQALSPR